VRATTQTVPSEVDREIAALIDQLAIAQEPAVMAPVYTPREDTPATDPRVVAYRAAARLKDYGKAAFPQLLARFGDERQSVCFRRAVPCTVGIACFTIIEMQVIPVPDDYAGSFGRLGADGKYHPRPYSNQPLLFDLATIGAWLQARSDRTLEELQLEGLEWLLAEERKIGFPDEQDRQQIEAPLERKIAQLKSTIAGQVPPAIRQ
jgi:hypothetical protein